MLEDLVAVALLVERERVLEARAAAAAHADAQAGRLDLGALGDEELADLLGALVGERDHRFSKYSDRSAALPLSTMATSMATKEELKERIEAGIPGASAEVHGDDGAPLRGRRRRPRVRRAVADRPAPARLRRVRRRARRPHPRPVPEDQGRVRTTVSDETQNPLRDAIAGRDRDERRDPLHEGHARSSRCAASPPAPPARCRRSRRRSRRSTSCPTRASARSCRRCRTGRRSRSCSSDGELVGGGDIVAEMYESGELAELLGVEQPEDEPAPAEPQRQRAAVDREPARLSRAGAARGPRRAAVQQLEQAPTVGGSLPPRVLATITAARASPSIRTCGLRYARRSGAPSRARTPS